MSDHAHDDQCLMFTQFCGHPMCLSRADVFMHVVHDALVNIVYDYDTS